MTVYLHIGLHKTGTSSIQAFLKKNKPALHRLGYLYPKAGWTAGGHHNLAYELLGKKRFSQTAGRLADLAPEIADEPNVILSSEEFEFLELAEVRRLREALGEREARIIVYLRRQDALIGSTYAQQVKMGAKMKPLADYAVASLYNARFDFAQLLQRWGAVFGPESLDVAVVSEETAGPMLFDDFLSRLGVKDAADLPRPPKRLNVSPSAAEIEIIRRAADKARRPGHPPRTQDMVELQQIAAELVAGSPELEASGGLWLPEGLYRRVAARFGPINARVTPVVGSRAQRAALAFDEVAPPAGRPLDEAAIAQAAARAGKRWAFAGAAHA